MALLADELRIVQHARRHRSVVYVMGRSYASLGKHTPLLQLPKRYLLELPFKARLSPLLLCSLRTVRSSLATLLLHCMRGSCMPFSCCGSQ